MKSSFRDKRISEEIMRKEYRSKDPLFMKDLHRIRSYFSYYKNREDIKIMKDARSQGLFSRLYFSYYNKWKAEREILEIQKEYEELAKLSEFKRSVE